MLKIFLLFLLLAGSIAAQMVMIPRQTITGFSINPNIIAAQGKPQICNMITGECWYECMSIDLNGVRVLPNGMKEMYYGLVITDSPKIAGDLCE